MFLGRGRKIQQRSLVQLALASIPLLGRVVSRIRYPRKRVTNTYPRNALSMHEFWTLSTGAGKSRMAFAKAVQAHRLGYGGMILDAASVLSTQFIRYLAHIG